MSNEKSLELERMRHSAAHVMAAAVCRIYKDVQLDIGPSTDDGFYYDFDLPDRITPEDFPRIEAEMQRLVKENHPFERFELPRAEAEKLIAEKGQRYKVERLADIPEGETISFYRCGEFVDLCRGPHVARTGDLHSFKLMSVAGSYYRGDVNNPMFQRVYGTAMASDAELKAYLDRIEEAKKRDHRVLGRQLDLFHMQEDNPGMVFWHARGWTLYRLLQDYVRRKIEVLGYHEVNTPSVMSRQLWEKSGHWEKYQENMFITESEKRIFSIKPMNCPGHVQIFNQGLRSYRDLPLRIAEFGSCVRNEPSGTLHGIMRVRGFVQDDAHIFCTEAQIPSEVANFCKLLKEMYADFGFHDIAVKFSTRPEKRVGADEVWDRAEAALARACEAAGLAYTLNPGEGAFYGPKLEFVLRDCIGRQWQCGTIQVDFNLPARLGAEYVGEDGQKHVPVMLHRAVLGSLERFIGILIENFAGAFPLWLAPEQVRVLPLTEKQKDHAAGILSRLQAEGFRTAMDERSEKIGAKIRQAQVDKIPYMLIVGQKEVDAGRVAVRSRVQGDLGAFSLDEVIARLRREEATKGLEAEPAQVEPRGEMPRQQAGGQP